MEAIFEPYAIVDTMERVAVDQNLQDAIAADQEVDAGSDGLRKGSMRVGWYGRIVKLKDRFQQMGYVDEKDYRLRKGVGRSTWYRMLRIADDFQDLDSATFLGMTAENAEHLSKLPVEERYKPEWIDKASTLNEGQFQKALLEAQAVSEGVETKEVMVSLKIPVFDGQRAVINEGIELFRQQHNLKTAAESLELIVVESMGRKTFTNFMQDALPRLRSAISLTRDVEPESAVEALRETVEQVIFDLAAALEEAGTQERWQQ